MGLPILDSSIPRVTQPQASPFADLVSAFDRAAMEHLGGVPVTYRPKVGDPVTVTGIFDRQFVLSDGGSAHPDTEASRPAVFLRLEDLPTNPRLDEPAVFIGGAEYSVVSDQPDDFGGVILVLLEVP